MAKKTIGTIHDKKKLFLRRHVGNVECGDDKYEVAVFVTRLSPMVLSKQTGKYFALSWQDIVELAIKAGIDK